LKGRDRTIVIRIRRCLLPALAVIAVGILAYVGFRPRVATTSPRADGPDFRVESQDLSRPFQIVVYGDMRFTDPDQTSAANPKVRRWLVEKIAAEKPDAVLLSGDVAWKGGEANDYAVYASETKSWHDAHLRIYPALGNHEFDGGGEKQCLENWWNAFPELRGRRLYSVQLGDSVYLLNLDSNSSLMPGSEQIAWIRGQLASLPSTVRFVFFNLHHPPVVDVQANGDSSHNGRPNEKALGEFLAKAPEKARARFVVTAGHIHNYERFFQNDIVYLVAGGGGAKPRSIQRSAADLYQDSAFPNYGYVRIVVKGDTMEGTMIRVANPDASTPSWEEKDHFQIPAAVRANSLTQTR
jgi:acid phosphatase type 7